MPQTPIALLLGADAFAGLPTWHRWEEVFTLAHVIAVSRPGTAVDGAMPPPLAARWRERLTTDRARLEIPSGGAIFHLQVTPQPFGSTDIRRALARGSAGRTAVKGMLPEAVLAYSDHHRLYRPLPDAT